MSCNNFLRIKCIGFIVVVGVVDFCLVITCWYIKKLLKTYKNCIKQKKKKKNHWVPDIFSVISKFYE